MAIDFGSASGALTVDGFCVALDLDLELTQLQITLPVGFSLDIEGPILPNPGDVSGKLLGQLNAALAPLSPLFDVVDLALVIVEIFNSLKSIPNVTKFKKLLPKLRVKVDKLKKLIPILSMPVSIKSIIRVLITFLEGLKFEIEAILKAQASIDLSRARATALGLADLGLSLDCSQANLDFQLALAFANASPLNRLINTINVFCDLAGVDGIPALTLEASAGAEGAVKPIVALIDAMKKLADAIPL